MTKKEFDKRLEKCLKTIDDAERREIIEYYDELFLDRLERGDLEEDIIQSFGSPEECANKAFDDSVVSKAIKYTKKKTKLFFTNKTFLIVYFSLFYITIPLTILALALSLVVFIVPLVLIIAFVCVMLSVTLAALVQFSCSLYLMTINFFSGLANLSVSLLALALGLTLIYCFLLLLRLVLKLFSRKKRSQNPIAQNAKKRIKGRPFLLSAATLVVISFIFFTVALFGVNLDIYALDSTNYTQIECPIIPDNLKEVVLDIDARSVEIVKSDASSIAAYSTESSKVTATIDGDKLIIEEKTSFNIFNVNCFNWLSWEKRTIKIYISNDIDLIDFNGDSATLRISDLNVDTIKSKIKSGTVRLSKITSHTIDITNISGTIKTNDITAEKISLKATSGTIKAEKINAKEISYNTSSGSIRFSDNEAVVFICETKSGSLSGELTASYIQTTANSGSIKLTVVGNKADYTINASVKSGTKNIDNQTGLTDKTLKVNVSSGRISVNFK